MQFQISPVDCWDVVKKIREHGGSWSGEVSNLEEVESKFACSKNQTLAVLLLDLRRFKRRDNCL